MDQCDDYDEILARYHELISKPLDFGKYAQLEEQMTFVDIEVIDYDMCEWNFNSTTGPLSELVEFLKLKSKLEIEDIKDDMKSTTETEGYIQYDLGKSLMESVENIVTTHLFI
jgi:hypothetical protein